MSHSLNPLVIENGWPMRNYEIRRALGVHEGRIPGDLEAGGLINGHFVWIEKSHGPGSKNRTWTRCPICSQTYSCGTLDQHMTTVHKETRI